MTLFVQVLLVGLVLYLLAEPFLRPEKKHPALSRGGRSASGRRRNRDGSPEARDKILRELSELEYDHRMAKIAPDDYRVLREELMTQAAGLLSVGGPDPEEDSDRLKQAIANEVEREIQREVEKEIAGGGVGGPSEGGAQTDFCPQCGTRMLSPGQKYCHRCGVSVN